MKKIIIILVTVITLTLISCEAEPDCGCGVVENVTQFNYPGGQSFGGYKLRNVCTGEITTYSYTGTPPRNGSTICNE